ncbi:alpha/beta fold hydrolase [Allosaccharopolyspora coralli]|uniref:Alpha/beta fold hydrolase n=1 Tax=Allosaccharopolyspora coralli TaxID=2665642 RepID=A0A5Q3Q9F2_9PSEU|nr:alpha/beta hydrolase [Allosaccharopolyspora coralli]QGK71003.1 alpha/beta fold hydrolase [Allosaccharopolyspora coralli]
MIEARYLTVDSCLSYVELAGSGPPVLLVHTAGQSGVQWRHTTGALAERGYRVIAPDLPGHGRSEPAPGGAVDDLGVYARWLRNLLDALEVHDPWIVGCSIGGKIALDLAARMADEARGVVAMAAEPMPGEISAAGLRRELEDVAAASRTDRTYLGTLAVVGRDVDPARAELIARMHRREDPEVSTSDLLGWAAHDLTDTLSSITCPARLVIGEDDLWVNSERARRAAEHLPDARCTVLPGIGHYPMEEIVDFPTVLDGWLGELAPTTSRSEVHA